MHSLRDTIWVLNKENITLTGISDRIKNYISKLQPSYSQVQFNFVETVAADIRVNSRDALNIFRIVQEAVHNALKHSNASSIDIAVYSDGSHGITVTDNGKGLTAGGQHGGGSGFANMKARAEGSGLVLKIYSGENSGTSVGLELSTIN